MKLRTFRRLAGECSGLLFVVARIVLEITTVLTLSQRKGGEGTDQCAENAKKLAVHRS
jgi:hypothetical protein